MEEKLYFEPASHGQKNQKKKSEKKNKTRIIKLIVFFSILIGIVLVLFFFLRGTNTTSGRFPDNIKNISLDCSSNSTTYSYTDKVNPKATEMKITMVFYGEQNLSSASLKYTMNFETPHDAGVAESVTHAQFAKALASSGLKFEEFDNKFSIIDNNLVLTLYFPKTITDEKTGSFFLVKNLPEENRLPKSLREYQKNYESQDFICKSTLYNN